ncbi:MAG TPA: rhodanese-like domain-containing protein [Acidimicrobiia bacterium]|mgnify:CR=1 FL=1|nr:rhodanese-like domain-containing protein [Acidimicrobiia bacterium]
MNSDNTIPEADVREALAAQNTGALLLDVREVDEFAAGHAVGAVSIPLSEIGQRVDELDKNIDIYVICKSGGRSAQVTAALNGIDYRAKNVRGGSLEWYAENLPFESDTSESATVL